MDSKVAGHRIRRAILMSIEGTHCTRVSIAGAGIPDSQAWKRLVYIGGGIFKACVTKRIYNRLINGSTAVLAALRDQLLSREVLQALAEHRCNGLEDSPTSKLSHRSFYAVVGLHHQYNAFETVMKWLNSILDPLIEAAWNEYLNLHPNISISPKRKEYHEIAPLRHKKAIVEGPSTDSEELAKTLFCHVVALLEGSGLRGLKLGEKIWFICQDSSDYPRLTILQRTRLRERLQDRLETPRGIQARPLPSNNHPSADVNGGVSSFDTEDEASSHEIEVSSPYYGAPSSNLSLDAPSTVSQVIPCCRGREHQMSDDSSDCEDICSSHDLPDLAPRPVVPSRKALGRECPETDSSVSDETDDLETSSSESES